MDGTPQRIGPYRLLEVLGRGGMGVVYRAEHGETGALAAVKALSVPSERGLSSLRREIHALARIRHPGIVRIVGEGVENGLPWYAMELLEGLTLRQSIEIQPAIPVQAALTLLRRLCAPLAFLHGEGAVHLDLKPENILLRNFEFSVSNSELERNSAQRAEIQNSKFKIQNSPWPVLMDFGLVHQFGGELGREALDSPGAAAGTLAYMAPEQILGEPLDARADLYALGCLLYELLTGRPPFVGKPREVVQQHLHAAPVPPSEHAGAATREARRLDALVLHLLAKRPRERLGHADDVAAALARLGAEDGLAAAGPRPRAYLYRPGLAGRQEALRQLEAQLEQLETGVGGLVLAGGESGAGKTRLALELARSAARRGILVLTGECLSPADPQASRQAEGSSPLGALKKPLQSLADRCRSWGEDETRRLLGRRAAVLAPYEPALAGLPGQAAVAEARDVAPLSAALAWLRLFRALTETFAALTDTGAQSAAPCLLVLDDLQWADELTLGWLDHLLREERLNRMPLLVLGTYRSEEIGEGLHKLLESPGARSLALGRLDEKAVSALVGDMLAVEPPPGVFARYLTHRSDGNPFFIAEYLRVAVGAGVLHRDEAGRWQVAETSEAQATEAQFEALPLPVSLHELVRRRLDSLGAGARRVAEAASVLGREFDEALLGAAARLEPGLTPAVEELLRRQILEEAGAGRLRFVHDQIREVAYKLIPEAPRRQLHQAAAEALEARPAAERDEALAVLGDHWEQAGFAQKSRVYYLAGARKAAPRYAHAEAERLYRAYSRLTEAPAPESIAARNELGVDVLAVQGRMDEALAEHRKALEESRKLGHRTSEAESLQSLAQLGRAQGQIESARGLLEETLGIAREVRDRRLEGRVLGDLAICHYEQGRIEEARKLFEQALAIHREVRDRRHEGIMLGHLGNCASAQGRIEEARKLYEQALAIHREVGNRRYEGIALGNLGISYYEQGRVEEARELYEQALAISREIGDRRYEGYVLGLLGSYHQDLDQFEEARKLHEQALAIDREVGNRRHEGLVLGNLAEMCTERLRFDEARELYEQALAIHREVGNRRYEGFVLADLGNLLRVTTDELSAAEKLAWQGAAMLEEAGVRLELGRVLCSLGHFELAARRSARPLIDRIDALVRELNTAPGSELGLHLARLKRTQEAFEAGQPLLRGELPEELPAELRRRLTEAGQPGQEGS